MSVVLPLRSRCILRRVSLCRVSVPESCGFRGDHLAGRFRLRLVDRGIAVACLAAAVAFERDGPLATPFCHASVSASPSVSSSTDAR